MIGVKIVNAAKERCRRKGIAYDKTVSTIACDKLAMIKNRF